MSGNSNIMLRVYMDLMGFKVPSLQESDKSNILYYALIKQRWTFLNSETNLINIKKRT